jgi:gluconate 2-dehydrogenase alpha chain
MADKLPSVDVLLVGFGWTGAILAHELSDTGLKILALERGKWRDTPTDFAPTFDQDELRYMWRHHLFQNVVNETLTFRNNRSQTALPIRKWGSFLPGEGVGGAGVHWNGQSWRFLESDFVIKSHNEKRYGKASVTAHDMTIQDWGVTYADLEPYYDKFEKLCGIAGKAGNLRGKIQEGGNPYEGPRANEYPTPPMEQTYGPALFAEAARSLGYRPFPQPSANMSQTYVNPLGVQLGPCTYCGFCEKFGCGNYSKSSPQTTILPALMRKDNFTLRTEATVLKLLTDSSGGKVTGVTYVDASGREYEQPAELVILCAFPFTNAQLMLVSGIGKPYDPNTGEGVVGRNYAYQVTSSVNVFFDDKYINPFIGAGSLGMTIDDFNGDNFDHKNLGFIAGGFIQVLNTGGRPIEMLYVPEGTPLWGPEWKKAAAKSYLRTTTVVTHGAVMSHRGNYLDLDPTYRDVYGRPLVRLTFDYTEQEQKMSDYLTDRAADIARAMHPASIKANYRKGPYNVVPYQTTHNTGGTAMGTDPRTSVVNPFLQSWDVSNLFIMGAGVFPQNAGYNPTMTVGALAYRAAEAIKNTYLKNPGPLVSKAGR